MDARYVVHSRPASNEHWIQHQPPKFWIGTAGWLSHLPGDGDRHRDQLVHSTSLSVRARNDYGVDICGDAALGDVAGNRIDGCRWADFARAEVELDRQDVSRSARK